MSLRPLAVGDTLVLSARAEAAADTMKPAILLPWPQAAGMHDVTALDVFRVASSNISPDGAVDTLQVHIGLQAGSLANELRTRELATHARHLLADTLPDLCNAMQAFSIRRLTGISRLTSRTESAGLAPYRYVLSCDVAPDAETELNHWYDDEHLPGLAGVPGVLEARRDLCRYGSPRYRACYDIEEAVIVGNEAWLAVRHTPWSTRMITTMRGVQRTLLRRIATFTRGGDMSPAAGA